MRPTRLITTIVVVATTVLLAVGLVAAPASAQPRHRVHATIERVTNHKFLVHGTVSLTHRRFVVLKRRAHTKKYEPLEQPRTKGNGKFRFTVTGNQGDCFLMKLPATSRYRATVVSLGCIHLAGRGRDRPAPTR